jgi:hypothetical protein
MHVKEVRVMKSTAPKGLDGAIEGSADSAVLVTAANYSLSDDGVTLEVDLTADLFARSIELSALRKGQGDRPSDPRNAIFRSILSYAETAPDRTEDRKANYALWSADHGALLRAALDRACKKLARELANDLQGQSLDSKAARPALLAAN